MLPHAAAPFLSLHRHRKELHGHVEAVNGRDVEEVLPNTLQTSAPPQSPVWHDPLLPSPPNKRLVRTQMRPLVLLAGTSSPRVPHHELPAATTAAQSHGGRPHRVGASVGDIYRGGIASGDKEEQQDERQEVAESRRGTHGHCVTTCACMGYLYSSTFL